MLNKTDIILNKETCIELSNFHAENINKVKNFEDAKKEIDLALYWANETAKLDSKIKKILIKECKHQMRRTVIDLLKLWFHYRKAV